mgnify:CR=1 FL=1|tara:strand:+ start:97 stop:405 length:309 start_codon:yes stop_codon:yes gene_type:complete
MPTTATLKNKTGATMKYFKKGLQVTRKSAIWGMTKQDKINFENLEYDMNNSSIISSFFNDDIKIQIQYCVNFEGCEYYFDTITESKLFCNEVCPNELYHIKK